MYQQQYIHKGMHFIDQQKSFNCYFSRKILKQYKKKEHSFLLENRQFEIKKPKERVTNSNRSAMGYKFLSNINFSFDKTREKYYFSKLNGLGPPPPRHLLHSKKAGQQF